MAARTPRGDLSDTARRLAARAGRSLLETWLFEPGLHAIAWHRLAHYFHTHGLGLCAGACATWGRLLTGSTIHPGAKLGRRCLIVDGPVVIGETTVVGDDCVLEAGAMLLGAPPTATVVGADVHAVARTHPSLGHRVRVEAGAVVTGDVFIGNDVHLHAGAVVTRDVPDQGVAVGVPGRVLARGQARPDPDARAIQAMAERLYALEERLQVLAFATQRQQGGIPRTRPSEEYGPIQAVEALIDGSGI